MNVISESIIALENTDWDAVDKTVDHLRSVRQVFCIGNGGGAAHAMHFAADLRKIAKVRAHSFDSIPEMTARINDQGWHEAWYDWIRAYDWDIKKDILFVLSVGGGLDRLSSNLPPAHWGIVGANGGWFNRIVIPSTSTPVIEGCQAVIAHHIVEELAS